VRSHEHLRRRCRVPTFAIALSLLLAACGEASVSVEPAPTASSMVAGSQTAGDPSSPRPCAADAGTRPERPWWSDRVFYEVFVRSFQDSDGDGIGDLQGLTNRLDQLNDGNPATTDDLGVTALWLMPVAESPSYHGYDVVDYRKIESDYGTADDFRAMMAAAHERGIAVIVDLVLNHTSRDHPWFRDALTAGSAHDDWYLWSDTRPAIARSDGAPVWHEAGGRFYYGYFWEGMPDLNIENPEVTAELDDIGRFWIEEMGVDGFRLDAARHLIEDGEKLGNTPATFSWLEGFRQRLKADHHDALVLGEVWDATSMSSRYVRDGSLDLSFDFGLASATILSLRSGDAGSLRAAEAEVIDAYPAGGLATFLTNHDQNRSFDQLDHDMPAARLAATLLLTSGGVPFIYYGEELGMTGRKPDERIRTPMHWDATGPYAGFTTGTPWEALDDDPPGTDVATQAGDPGSLLSHYRDLIRLRAAHPALTAGDWVTIDAAASSIVAYLRVDGSETLLVVANVSDEPVADLELSLDEGPLCGEPRGEALLGRADTAAWPVVTATGGFEGYRPIEALGPREAIVIFLAQ
jgi:alpha-amylase